MFLPQYINIHKPWWFHFGSKTPSLATNLEVHRLGCLGKHMVKIFLTHPYTKDIYSTGNMDSLEISTLAHLVEYEWGLLHLEKKHVLYRNVNTCCFQKKSSRTCPVIRHIHVAFIYAPSNELVFFNPLIIRCVSGATLCPSCVGQLRGTASQG